MTKERIAELRRIAREEMSFAKGLLFGELLDAFEAIEQRDADLVGQELNNARTIMRTIQSDVEELRDGGELSPHETLDRIEKAAVRAEELLADVVRKLRPPL